MIRALPFYNEVIVLGQVTAEDFIIDPAQLHNAADHVSLQSRRSALSSINQKIELCSEALSVLEQNYHCCLQLRQYGKLNSYVKIFHQEFYVEWQHATTVAKLRQRCVDADAKRDAFFISGEYDRQFREWLEEEVEKVNHEVRSSNVDDIRRLVQDMPRDSEIYRHCDKIVKQQEVVRNLTKKLSKARDSLSKYRQAELLRLLIDWRNNGTPELVTGMLKEKLEGEEGLKYFQERFFG